MFCPIEEGVRDWECCVKRVQASERDKRGCGCIQCAGGVSVSEATSKPHPPAASSHLHSSPGLHATHGENTPWKETNSGLVSGGSAKLRTRGGRKAALLSSPSRVFLLPSPRALTTRRARGALRCCGAVRCCAVRAWRYQPEQRRLEARNERVEASFAVAFETGPDASLRPTIAHRLLVFLDEAFRPERGREKKDKKEGTRRHTRAHTQVGGYDVPSEPTPGK